MKSFIRVVELWTPDESRSLLEFGGGLYGDASRFGAVSANMCFGRGEGLPGQAWESARPIVLNGFEGSSFRRIAAAQAEGLSCGIAVPFFAGGGLTAVMLIFCGDDESHAGAIELWHNDPAVSADLKLDDGYYGTTAEVFEFMSRHTSFRKGTGLPGLAWESGLPVFMPDLGKGTRFLRSDSALQVGINRGFAIPCATPGKDAYVLAFLSALATPIVRRFETWVVDPSGQSLLRRDGFCEQQGVLESGGTPVARGQGTLGRAWTQAAPAICAQALDEPGAPGAAALEAGLSAMLALPVLRDDSVVAIVLWYF